MRAAPLHHVVAEPDHVLVARPLGVPALGVGHALGREALEEGEDVLVVVAPSPGPKPHREEQAVHPVDLVVRDEGFDEAPVDA